MKMTVNGRSRDTCCRGCSYEKSAYDRARTRRKIKRREKQRWRREELTNS